MVQSRVSRQTHDQAGEGAAGRCSESSKTQKSLDKLAHLDTLKTRMESARDVLREAESWSSLEGELTSFITNGAWEKAGNRLSEASKSLVVFQATPAEYDARKQLLVSLQNELETALSVALQEALGKSDTPEIAKFGRIFDQMDRGGEFRNYYFSAKRIVILDEWATFDGERFSTFLPKFYGVVLSTLQAERAQIPNVFVTNAVDVLGAFLETTLNALSPSLQTRLATMADALGAQALPELIRAYKGTEELALAVHGLVEKMMPSPIPNQDMPLPSPSIATSPTSLLTPITARPALAPQPTRSQDMFTWETSLFESFLPLQLSYTTLEKRYLQYILHHDLALTAVRKDAASLSERSTTAFNLASEAITRCQAWTHGYGAKGLVEALGEFLAAFFESQQSISQPTPIQAPPDELDFGEGIDYTTEDWAAFQAGLHVLKTCGDVGTKLRAFEEKVYTFLASVNTLTSASSSSASVALVAQSPLNSSELHHLLSSLTPPVSPLSPARNALSALARKSQVSLQNIILSPLRSLLSSYPSLSVWVQSEKPRRDGLVIPTFSLSPTDTMSRISEGLLNLLRVFEVHAGDDALAYSIETLPHIEPQHLAELRQASTASAPITPGTHHSLAGSQVALEPELVIATWVSSLALTLLADLTKKTLPNLKSLSGSGANQLAADLGYLGNAVRALDVDWEELDLWKSAVEMDETEWRSKLREAPLGAAEILTRVGRLRGWTVGP